MTTSSRFGESVPAQTLGDGYEIPTLALGVWQTAEGSQTKDAVRWALELGYRHIDTAQGYGNEESVGEGFRESGLDRSDVFITTKFYPGSEDPVREIETSLQRLRLEYVDTSPPVANQINLNPFSYRRELIEENRRRNLVTEAYSPLGTGRHLSNPGVKEIADRVGRSPSQVLIRWGLQHDFVVLAKSAHRERIAENAGALGFSLSEVEMTELDRLDAGSRPGAALERKWW
jgi:diketogulonate reductase-like aldo/keto reductase